jgi:hypothetical protein
MSKMAFAFPATLALAFATGCSSSPPVENDLIKPVYSKETGRLEQLTADRDHDGKIDTRAYMDGSHLKFIELDRNNDGVPDRWEYYTPGAPTGGAKAGAGSAFDSGTLIERAEEANGPDGKVTRREYYTDGRIVRVEEDSDFDGRVDKWEQYRNGALVRMDLDLQGRGKPDRRLVYGADGSLDHVEIDPTGTGAWAPAPVEPPPPAPGPAPKTDNKKSGGDRS